MDVCEEEAHQHGREKVGGWMAVGNHAASFGVSVWRS
jgi:hypothetical protein